MIFLYQRKSFETGEPFLRCQIQKINHRYSKSSNGEPQVNFSGNSTILSVNNVIAFHYSIPKFVKYKTE